VKLGFTAVVAAGALLSIGVMGWPASAGAATQPSGPSTNASSVPPGHLKHAFVGPLHHTTAVASTMPDINGDLNPYGVAVVPRTTNALTQGNVLVSNFNNADNLQGTGSTIVQISPHGDMRLFAHITESALPRPCPGGIGLTTALVALRSGFVIVGSLPTIDGSAATSGPGCLIVLNSSGRVVETIAGHGINGPWDMTALDNDTQVDLFVTNVLNGTVAGNGAIVRQGTVLRLNLIVEPHRAPRVTAITTIGSGFAEHTDPAALVVGPTGVGLAKNGTLFVADTVDNRITAIKNAVKRDDSAGTGRVISSDQSLSGPLGLAIAPNQNILTVNSLDGNLVETRPDGRQVAVRTLDISGTPPGAGALFGLAVNPASPSVYFVDDATNTLDLLF
jgi:hypothetical protein